VDLAMVYHHCRAVARGPSDRAARDAFLTASGDFTELLG
jgi:hypothetical protein